MSIYIEDLVINNFFLTYAIGLLSYRVTLSNLSKKRAALAATVGTVLALIYPLLENEWISVGLLVLTFVAVTLTMFVGKQRYLLSSAVFFMLSAAFGGIYLALAFCFGQGDARSPTVSLRFPPGLIVAVALLLYRVCCRFFVKTSRIRAGKLGYPVSLTLFDTELSLRGMLDTGNRLFDSQSGLPVVVIKASVLPDKIPPYAFDALFRPRGEQRRLRCMTYSTVAGGVNKMPLLSPSRFAVRIDGEERECDVVLGVSFLGFPSEYDLILHPSLF